MAIVPTPCTAVVSASRVARLICGSAGVDPASLAGAGGGSGRSRLTGRPLSDEPTSLRRQPKPYVAADLNPHSWRRGDPHLSPARHLDQIVARVAQKGLA